MRILLLAVGIFLLFTLYLSIIGIICILAYWGLNKQDEAKVKKERKTYNRETLMDMR